MLPGLRFSELDLYFGQTADEIKAFILKNGEALLMFLDGIKAEKIQECLDEDRNLMLLTNLMDVEIGIYLDTELTRDDIALLDVVNNKNGDMVRIKVDKQISVEELESEVVSAALKLTNVKHPKEVARKFLEIVD